MDHKESILSALNALRLDAMRSTDPSTKFKVIAYNKAISSIRGVTSPIRNIDDVKGLPGVGLKFLSNIEEIMKTGRLESAEQAAAAPESVTMDMLLKIHGIGPVKARKLLAGGIRDITSLRDAVDADPDLLNNVQKIGLRHYADGCTRIPRSEITEHEKHIHDFISSPLEWIIAGSYRRRAETSGDIDILISYKSDKPEDVRKAHADFQNSIASMTKAGYIVDVLSHGAKKWMGYVRLHPDLPARRLDMMIVPPEEYPYAILYFTGSDKFNVAMRGYCLKLGYTLNEHRLACTDSERSAPPLITTEESIFEFIGLKYIHPHERVDARQIIKISKKAAVAAVAAVGGAGAASAASTEH